MFRPKKLPPVDQPENNTLQVVVWQERIRPEGWQAKIQRYWRYNDREGWWSDTNYLTPVRPTRAEVCKQCQDEIDRLARKKQTREVC